MAYAELVEISKKIKADEVLCGVSFSVERGMVVGLEGENGSGKTMSMRVLCGLVHPTSGEVIVDGVRLDQKGLFPSSVGALIEEPALLNYRSGIDNLSLIASIKGKVGKEELREVMRRVGLDPDNRKRCRTYSQGMRQRLGLAMALMEAPDLLVLDEPTNALDEDGVGDLQRMVLEEKERGAAVLVSSHDHDFLTAVCDRIYRMKLGSIVGEEEVRQ